MWCVCVCVCVCVCAGARTNYGSIVKPGLTSAPSTAAHAGQLVVNYQITLNISDLSPFMCIASVNLQVLYSCT